jgi:transcriptional regulator GlxA family with amidase domain
VNPDVIWRTLELAMRACPALSVESARGVELTVRAEFEGERVWIAKQPFHPDRRSGPPSISLDKAREVLRDVIAEPHTTTEELTRRHGVSRASLYRLLKRGLTQG